MRSGLSFLAAAREFPEREAWVVDGRPLSFGTLAPRVAAAAGTLLERVAGRNDRPVGLVGASRLDSLLWLAGAIEVGIPVALAHPRSTREEAESLFETCGVGVVLEGSPPAHGRLAANQREAPDEAGILAVVQTSGSSGRPGAVALGRRAFVASAAASTANLGWKRGDRWLLSLPIAHVGGLSILTRCLLARRTVVVGTRDRFDPDAVAQTLRNRRVTLLSLVPTTLARLLELDSWEPPEHLRAVLVGGAPAGPELLARARAKGLPALATYGLTEACSQVATQRLHSELSSSSASCGRPLPGLEIRIRQGRVELRGDSLLAGIYREGRLRPRAPDAWWTTGDLGSLDAAGRLTVYGRADRVILSGGENVLAEEVERCLCTYPGLSEACVFPLADPEWGQVVAAAVVAPARVDLEDLRDFLRPHLAPFKHPRRLFQPEALPRLPSGKIDVRAVRVRYGTEA